LAIPSRTARSAAPPQNRLAALTLGALGVVFSDIGTSPLYAFKEAFGGSHELAVSEAHVFGARAAAAAGRSLFFHGVAAQQSTRFMVRVQLRVETGGSQ
jgi:hypothetical protein